MGIKHIHHLCKIVQRARKPIDLVDDDDSLETLRQMVVAGMGITLIPEIALEDSGHLVYIPFKNPKPQRLIGMAYRKTSPLKTCIETLGQMLSQQ